MRAAPALQIRLVHFGVWHFVVWLLTLAAALSLVMWIASVRPGLDIGWLAGGAVALSLIIGSGVHLSRVAPRLLRWDGVAWHVAPLTEPIGPGVSGVSGELSVALDLGIWMLLRHRGDGAARWAESAWLPVQRRGLEAQWHTLRCAVYSPRPEPGSPP